MLLTCDHDINNYHHYKNNNKKHKEKYIESSITNNENNTDVKTKKVNNSLTYQTNINQINVDNDKLEQNFVEKKNYLNDKHYNNINNNIIANNYRNHHHIQNDNKNSNNQSLSKPRSVTLLKTRLLPNAHNKFSPEVINRTLADIGENLTHVVAIEQSRSSSGSINKDEKYKLNKKNISFPQKERVVILTIYIL